MAAINKYIPFAFIYFFVNAVALPFGLTYTTLLAPLFYVWILLVRKKEVLLPFLIILLPFFIMHYTTGVDLQSYGISLLNMTGVYIFCQAFYTFLKTCSDVEKILHYVLVVNFIFCLVAIPFYFSPYHHWFWMEQNISSGLADTRRLRLLTYEPSYYALLFTPVFLFFLLQYLFRQNRLPGGVLLVMLFLPFVLSFSTGVIGCLLLSGLLTWVIYFNRLTRLRRVLNGLIITGFSMLTAGIMLFFFFRDNPLFLRLSNVFLGRDTSARGRTDEAFLLAHKILQTGNEYWGIGWGQLKWVGEDLIRSFYLYYENTPVAIPNAAAETLVILGWTGFITRIGLEIILFFLTRVWTSYFRLLLFFFMFFYQFAGSFITNGAEYVIWILAFTNVFPQFGVKQGSRPATPLWPPREG